MNQGNLLPKVEKTRMAAYCRVSTNHEEQLLSYENQVRFYTEYINGDPNLELIGIYADEGLSATNTKKRINFNRMIKDCEEGKIDRIITKSISRFARNTLDCLNYVRKLKELGIGIYFEKENIDTLDSKGEVLLTILSSLAQDESRSISENCQWGIKRRFEQGQITVNHNKFLGYTKDEDGNLIIDKEQAKVVKRIYKEFIEGYGVNQIIQRLEKDGIRNGNNKRKWYSSNIYCILTNEKYKGDALLQKTYTVDFLSKTRAQNKGQVPMYYVEDSHEAIIDKDTWECAQLEHKRRQEFIATHKMQKYDHDFDKRPLAGRIICGECGRAFKRTAWGYHNSKGPTYGWYCVNRYVKKGIKGCENRQVNEDTMLSICMKVYNSILQQSELYKNKWKLMIKGENLLNREKAKILLRWVEKATPMVRFDNDLIQKTLSHITVFKDGRLLITLVEGTQIKEKLQ